MTQQTARFFNGNRGRVGSRVITGVGGYFAAIYIAFMSCPSRSFEGEVHVDCAGSRTIERVLSSTALSP